MPSTGKLLLIWWCTAKISLGCKIKFEEKKFKNICKMKNDITHTQRHSETKYGK